MKDVETLTEVVTQERCAHTHVHPHPLCCAPRIDLIQSPPPSSSSTSQMAARGCLVTWHPFPSSPQTTVISSVPNLGAPGSCCYRTSSYEVCQGGPLFFLPVFSSQGPITAPTVVRAYPQVVPGNALPCSK
jgi:hypothetical protein